MGVIGQHAPGAGNPGAVLAAAGICAGYRGRTVLDEVDLAYAAGLHLLLGPNGAGKTTLFRVLAGVLAPTRGQILVGGRDPHTDHAAKSLIGLSSHRAALVPRLSVADNLRFWARVLGLVSGARERRVEEAMAAMELTEIGGQRAGTLSRGQAQRVGLARALLSDPPVLLLDEPTAGVDVGMAALLRNQMRFLADTGRTIVASTHELAEAGELADDVTVLHQGRIVGQGKPGELQRWLIGRAHRVRLRGSGDLLGSLARLGYAAQAAPRDGAIVEVSDEDAVEDLVTRLVQAGVGIHEVSFASNALQDVYTHLEEAGHAGH